MRVRYENAEDVKRLAEEIVTTLEMDYIDLKRVAFVRSFGTKTNAVARCHGLGRIWQHALGIKAHYVIEIISEKFDKLSQEEKEKVIIHELLHIPKSFGGGLRGHDHANFRKVRKLHSLYKKRKAKEDSSQALSIQAFL